eukprot:4469728-Alexandrium_andersonii.AAC.1
MPQRGVVRRGGRIDKTTFDTPETVPLLRRCINLEDCSHVGNDIAARRRGGGRNQNERNQT